MKQIAMALILMVSVLQGATIRVPQDQATIQAGINAAVDGDTVSVGPGTYSESLVVSGKSVILLASGGPNLTFLSSPNKVTFTNCANSSIQGFRFLSGGTNAQDYGHHQVIDCRFIEVGVNGVGLIRGDGSSVVKVRRCLIKNYSDLAIFLQAPGCEVINNSIDGGNRALAVYGQNSIIKNNIVVNMGYYATWDIFAGTVLDYNNFWNNNPNYGGNANAGPHDIHLNPLFSNSGMGDYSLAQNSPCIDAGDPNPIYNDPDGSRNDMGAFPLYMPDTRKEVPLEYPTIQAAIDAAVDGDTVLISDGTYHERISFNSKAIVVGSWILIDSDTSHMLNTVIDGDSDTNSVVTITGMSGSRMLAGFTIMNGAREGIICSETKVAINHCRLVGNGIRKISEGMLTLAYSSLIGCGARLAYENTHLRHCTVEGVISNSFPWAGFRADSCTLGDVAFDPYHGIAELRYCLVNGNVGGDIGVFAKDCVFSGDLLTWDNVIRADSCIIRSLICSQESQNYISNSLILDGIRFEAWGGFDPELVLSHCTVLDSIVVNVEGILLLRIDSCNVHLQTPIRFTDEWRNVGIHCSNIYAGLEGWYTGVPNTAYPLDTVSVFSAPPLFCDTASGDYRIKDSSPCAPANNSCGVLIGAYEIGCANIAPVLTSADSVQAVSGLGFVYKATSTDVDGPSTIYSFINLPSWLTANGDSAFGTPPLTDVDTSFMVIVSDGFLADSQLVTVEITESPVISALTTEGVAIAMNVISHTPTFSWQYFDATGSYQQTQFEIGVGSDSDWTYSELWNPAPFTGDATSRQYAGAALLDGQTYWVRARVRNALIWSNWKQTSFRMNSVPGVPEQRLPVDNSIVNTEHPTLVVRNPSDAENDSMLITFELSADSFATSIFPIQVKASSDSLTSFWVNFPLNEDLRFWWRVKASDYYEESLYSPIWSFWVNSVNSTPTAFGLLSPPNGASPALPGNLPEFTWENSLDFDPWDSVEFTLQLAIDPSFSFMSQISGLTSPHHLTATPLEWGRRYWWRVKAEDKSTGVRWSNETFDFKIMALGDADGSGTVTISDVVYLINYIFGGGAAPNPIESGDADCSGAVTISDVVYLINYIFAGTAAPCEG